MYSLENAARRAESVGDPIEALTYADFSAGELSVTINSTLCSVSIGCKGLRRDGKGKSPLLAVTIDGFESALAREELAVLLNLLLWPLCAQG